MVRYLNILFYFSNPHFGQAVIIIIFFQKLMFMVTKQCHQHSASTVFQQLSPEGLCNWFYERRFLQKMQIKNWKNKKKKSKQSCCFFKFLIRRQNPYLVYYEQFFISNNLLGTKSWQFNCFFVWFPPTIISWKKPVKTGGIQAPPMQIQFKGMKKRNANSPGKAGRACAGLTGKGVPGVGFPAPEHTWWL